MDINSIPFVTYCDLEIVNLKIWSTKLWDTRLVCTTDKARTGVPIVNVILCDHLNSDFSRPETYREVVMRSGYYVGHHFGNPVYLKWIDNYNMILLCDNPGRIIWSYVIKIILTIFAYKQNILHIKGSTIEYKNRAFLVLGRGGSGKTEFIKTLCEHNAKLMGNTHALIKDDLVFGIKSNIRVRNDGKEKYYSINDDGGILHYSGWAPIGGVFWLQYRVDGINTISKLDVTAAYHNLRWFSEAIGNWEMKEDVADYYKSDPNQFSQCMAKIDNMLLKFSERHSVYYANLDIHSSDGINKVISFMEEQISQENCYD